MARGVIRISVMLFFLGCLAGCTYLEDRGADLADCLLFGCNVGWGLQASVTASQFDVAAGVGHDSVGFGKTEYWDRVGCYEEGSLVFGPMTIIMGLAGSSHINPRPLITLMLTHSLYKSVDGVLVQGV